MAWSAEENKSLLEFVLQSGDTGSWPSHPRASPFWEDAACFVFQESNSATMRTGRLSMLHCLSQKNKHCGSKGATDSLQPGSYVIVARIICCGDRISCHYIPGYSVTSLSSIRYYTILRHF